MCCRQFPTEAWIFCSRKKEISFGRLSGGTVLQAKEWPLEADGRYFGVRFLRDSVFCPKDSQPKSWSMRISRYPETLMEIILQNRLWKRTIWRNRRGFFWKAMRSVWTGKEKSRDGAGWRGTSAPESMPAEEMCRWDTLVEETGYSACYIRRSFERVHGVAPKTFEKFIRFQNVLHQINYKADKSYEEIALECGYYDQAHMIHEFRRFAGVTPKVYREITAKTPPAMLE